MAAASKNTGASFHMMIERLKQFLDAQINWWTSLQEGDN